MKNIMLKMLLLVMLLKEMILLPMEKFQLSHKNHPYHLLLYILYHYNHLKIFHQHLRYNLLHHNHLRRVEHLEYDKVAQALEINKLKRMVKKLEKGNRGRIIDELDKDDAVALMDNKEEDKKEEEAKRLLLLPVKQLLLPVQLKRKGVVIRDPEEESTTSLIIPAETKFKDKGKGIMVEEPKPLKKKQQVKMDEEYARKLHAELNTKEQIEDEESKALQSINETPAQKVAKRRKLNEEVEDLKRHLAIVVDEDDDVYTKATPLGRKVPVVDYEIINLNNKPYYKIIQADAKNFSDDFLLTTLGAMFEKPDAQAQVWKNQRSIHGQAKVKT
nr:hypothetical protein [Tanacetum cinerariifolium]